MKDERFLRVREAARLLGVSPQTVYSWIHRKQIKATNFTRSHAKKKRALWRVPLSEIEQIIGLPFCPRTLKAIVSPAVCIHCKRDCPRAGGNTRKGGKSEK